MRKSENDHCAMSELSMGEESLGLKPGLAELKLEPGIHRFGPKFRKNYSRRLSGMETRNQWSTHRTRLLESLTRFGRL